MPPNKSPFRFQQGQRSAKAPEPPPQEFPPLPPPEVPIDPDRSTVFITDHPKAIVLHCSDGRFTRSIECLMQEFGLPRYDTMALPGGPALLDMMAANIGEAEATRTGMSYLVRAHQIEHAVLVAHVGCGYYESRFGGQPADVVAKKQVRDLQAAAAWFRRAHPTVQVKLCVALVRADRVVFQPFEVDTQASGLL